MVQWWPLFRRTAKTFDYATRGVGIMVFGGAIATYSYRKMSPSRKLGCGCGRTDDIQKFPMVSTHFCDGCLPVYEISNGKHITQQHQKNPKHIAIFPAQDDVPLTEFTHSLVEAMRIYGTVHHYHYVGTKLVEHCSQHHGSSLLYIAYDFFFRQPRHDVHIYQFNVPSLDCEQQLEQADYVLVVGKGVCGNIPTDRLPKLHGILEESLMKANAKVGLVLLWPSGTRDPSNTSYWLKQWNPVTEHYHIRLPKELFSSSIRQTGCLSLKDLEACMRHEFDNRTSDINRLARVLSGNAIGLVLGGGGARAAAHVGVIRTLHKLNIPIDYIGGNSMGSFVSASYAKSLDPKAVEEDTRVLFSRLKFHWTQLLDFTFPYLSVFTGHNFNAAIYDAFGDRLIEDLWIPYFNVTTDIMENGCRLHRSGRLWRYCRSSMSIAGLVPPVCNYDSHLLLDGGYISNVPVDKMLLMTGISKVIAIDVGMKDPSNLLTYGQEIDGLRLAKCKFVQYMPWFKNQFGEILSFVTLQLRLSYMNAARTQDWSCEPRCHYWRPAVDEYRLFDFSFFDEICALGQVDEEFRSISESLHSNGS